MVKVKRSAKKTGPQNDFYEWLCDYLEKNGAKDRIGDIAKRLNATVFFHEDMTRHLTILNII